MKKNPAKKYDLRLAIEAVRVLCFEIHPYKECLSLAYAPRTELLKKQKNKNQNLSCVFPADNTHIQSPGLVRKKADFAEIFIL